MELPAPGAPDLAISSLKIACWTSGTMLAPDKVELCYMARIGADRVASCTVLTKQP